MDRETEERWRAALEKKGMYAVQAELDMRPGRPSDPVYDLSDEPPYPTRAFCEAWCRGAPPKGFGISGVSAMIIAMSVLVVVCIVHAISSWGPTDPGMQSSQMAPSLRSSGAPMVMNGTAGPATTLQDSAQQNASAQNTSIISTTPQSTMLAPCSSVSDPGDFQSVRPLAPCSKQGASAGAQYNGRAPRPGGGVIGAGISAVPPISTPVAPSSGSTISAAPTGSSSTGD